MDVNPNPRLLVVNKTYNFTPVFFALLLVAVLYFFQLVFQGGNSYVSPDGKLYLDIARGQPVPSPFNGRLLQPFLAFLLSQSGLTVDNGFRILTFIEIILSLYLLARIINRRGGTYLWQASIVFSLGFHLAVFFGHAPILVDTMLLLLTCLMMEFLDTDHLWFALFVACVAATTKEYGIFLGFVWGGQAFRRGYRWLAGAGALLPALTLGDLGWIHPARALEGAGVSGGMTGFFWSTLNYMLELFDLYGRNGIPKLIYLWMWFVIWPVLLLAILKLVAEVRAEPGSFKQKDTLSFCLVLTSLPILLLGDWNRSLLFLLPFACAMATIHPISKNRWFALFLLIGGICTSLTQPYFYAINLPYLFNALMIGCSLTSSVMLLSIVVRFRSNPLTKGEPAKL